MNKSIKRISYASIIGILVIGGIWGVAKAVFYPVEVQSFVLCGSGSTIGDTTICLQSFNDVSGIALSMTAFGAQGFGTIDPNNGSQEESVTFTGVTQNSNGTATLTGVNSVTLYQPFVLTGNITKNHAGGATFVISNTAYFYNRIYINADDPTAAQNVATRNYVDSRAFGGIGAASESATGTVQIATNLQAASSTKNGTIGRLALPASISTSTFNVNTAALSVVVTQNNGKIDNNFIATSSGLFTNAVFATSSVTIGAFPAYQIGKNAQYITTTGTSTFNVPSGITMLFVRMCGAGGQGSTGAGGGAGAYTEGMVNVTGTTTVQVSIGVGNTAQNSNGADTQFLGYMVAGGGGHPTGGVGAIEASTTGIASSGEPGTTNTSGTVGISPFGGTYCSGGNNGGSTSNGPGLIIVTW